MQRGGVGQGEGNANISRPVHAVHLRLHIRIDERPITCRAPAAGYDRRLHREAAIGRVANEPEVRPVPRRKASLRREQFHFRAAAAFVENQIQRVIARSREIESLQGVAGSAWVRIRRAEAADREAETVVAIDAESPVARRGNGDGGRRFDHKIVLVQIDGETRKRVVMVVMGRAAGVEVVDQRRIFRSHGELL